MTAVNAQFFSKRCVVAMAKRERHKTNPPGERWKFTLRTLLGVVTTWAIVLFLAVSAGPFWPGAFLFWTGAFLFWLAAANGRPVLMCASVVLSVIGIVVAAVYC